MGFAEQLDAIKTQKNMDKYGLHWFKFDEASGNITDSKGTAVGTVNGATRVVGFSGNALSFNGTNNYVQLNGKYIPIGKKSIRFKIKTTQSPSVLAGIITDCSGTGAHGNYLGLNPDGTITASSNYASSGNTRYSLKSIAKINDGQWHDILFTWDGTLNANGVKLYVDDMKNPNIIGKASVLETNAPQANVHIGVLYSTNSPFYNYPFNGQIDELEIYNDVINPLIPIDKTLVRKSDGKVVYYGQNPTTLDNEWINLGDSPTDEDWLNKGADVVTQAQLEKLSQQAITGRFAVKRL